MLTLLQFVSLLLTIYTLCVFAWALLSWLPMVSPGLAHNDLVASIRGFLDSIVLPYVSLFRFVQPVRIGGTYLDLSALIAIVVLFVAGALVSELMESVAGV